VKHVWVSALLVLVVSLTALASQWGVGISSEPMDIAGGGFFMDSYIDVPMIAFQDVTSLSLKPSLGLGPLPVNPQVLFLDLLVALSLSIGDISTYVGAGPSFMVSTDWLSSVLCVKRGARKD